jgi:hypothetical protein
MFTWQLTTGNDVEGALSTGAPPTTPVNGTGDVAGDGNTTVAVSIDVGAANGGYAMSTSTACAVVPCDVGS